MDKFSSDIIKHIGKGLFKALNEIAVLSGQLEENVIIINNIEYYIVDYQGLKNLIGPNGYYLENSCDDIIDFPDYVLFIINGEKIKVNK